MLERAIAYLRPDLTDEPGVPDVILAEEHAPVLRPLGNGMLVAYLIDERRPFPLGAGEASFDRGGHSRCVT